MIIVRRTAERLRPVIPHDAVILDVGLANGDLAAGLLPFVPGAGIHAGRH
jgi:hypothetical protein